MLDKKLEKLINIIGFSGTKITTKAREMRQKILADGVRFELTVRQNARRFSRPVP